MPGLLTRRRPLPKPSPERDPRFRKVMEDLKRGAARSKAHPPAAKKAAEASAAAKGPPQERLAAGKAQQVDRIQQAPEKKPETSSFLAMLQAEIAKAMPKTLGDTEKFMKGGSSEQLKGSLKGNVAQQKDQAAGGVKAAEKEQPKEAGTPTAGKPIPAEAAPPPPAVNGAEAAPAPKSDSDVSLQDSKQDVQDQMKQAEVTDTQLKKANDPRFSGVLTAKDQVAKQADAGPAQYRAQEKQVISASAAGAQGAAAKGAAAIIGVRGGSNSAVLARQAQAKANDEKKRKDVVDQIEQIYNETKTAVENKLNSLETDVNAMFDAGTDAALKAMSDYVDSRITRYKLERYLLRPFGLALWIKDQFLGLPEEVNAFYEAGRALFTGLMNRLVVNVAALVEQRLKDAKNEVAKGQARIKAFVASQPKELQAVAQQAQAAVADRFKELESSIDDKKQQLAESLAQKYKEGFDKANEALKKLQDENKGLVAGFVEKLQGVIAAIIEFKNKLMAVLKKGADAIKKILDDPIAFLGNLLSAIKQGFTQFVGNIWTHLKAGFMKWLFGALAETGIEIPSDLTLPSILKLVLGVLGITYERMRAKAVKLIGERAVKAIEKVVEYVQVLIQGGPKALWEKVKEDLSNLKAMVIEAIQDWLITTIIKKAVAKIVSMFNPAGAIIQAVLTIVDVVTFVVEKANQILEFVSAVVDSVAAIAEGNIGGAASWIEKSLANMIPLLIGFLAQWLGLGGISKKIKETITKVQNAVDKAIDKAIAKIVGFVKKLFGGKGKDGKPDERPDAQKQADLNTAVAEADKYLEDDELEPEAVSQKLEGIKTKHKLTTLTLVVDGKTEEEETDHVEGAINPNKKTPKKQRIVRMRNTPITFECDSKEYDAVEFQDQLSGQQAGLNKLKVDGWLTNRTNYQRVGRDPKGATAQRKFREQERTRLIAEKIAAGMKPKQAEKEVAKFMKTQAALHDPDQIAGGDPTIIRKLGSKYINSSIGSQWKQNVGDLDKAVAKVPPKRRSKLHMNVTLKLKKV